MRRCRRNRYSSAQARASGRKYRAPGLIQSKRQKRVARAIRRARLYRPGALRGETPTFGNPRRLTVPEKHQLRIARQTLKMSDAMVSVMGGMSKGEARQIIYRLTGKAAKNRRCRNRNSVGGEILAQLGGSKFRAMTGAKDFVRSSDSLRFKLPSNFAKHGINLVRITLDPSDTYTMTFYKMHGTDVREIEEISGVYADQLRDIFTDVTGLDTSLGSIANPLRKAFPPSRYRIVRRNPKPMVWFDNGIQKYTGSMYSERFGNVYASGFTKKEALKNLRDRLRSMRKAGTWRAS
jgi:hypothetical protein